MSLRHAPNRPQEPAGGIDQYSEQENDAILKALVSDLRTLKGSSKSIQQEIGRHIKLLDRLEGSFTSARGALNRTMNKLEKVTGLSSVSHMWILILFAFVVFVFIYLMLKFK